MKHWKRFLPLALFLGFCVLLYAGLFLENKSVLPSVLLDKPVPEYSLSTLKEPEKKATQDTLRGKVYLMNIWGTWCVACKYEHPYLVKLAKEGIQILGVNYKDNREDALKWLDRLGDPYLYNVVDESGRFGVDLGVYGAPETYVVDRQGVIRYKHVGVVDDKVWAETLKPIYNALQKEAEK